MGRVVGLTGFAQSGKDTAASFLVKRGWTRIAFADILRQSLYNLNPPVGTTVVPVYDHFYSAYSGEGCWGFGDTPITEYKATTYRVQQIVDAIGWDRAKVEYEEIRELLQRFGTEVGRELYGTDFWVEMALKKIKTHPLAVFGSPEEVDGDYVITDVRFPNEEAAVHNLGGKVYRIQRPGTGAVNPHPSEAHVLTMPVDGVILNDGDLERYEAEVLRTVGLPLD